MTIAVAWSIVHSASYANLPDRTPSHDASRRGNHEVMARGTFANVRLRNQLVPGVEGGYTLGQDGAVTTVYEAAMAYRDAGVPLVLVAGKEYGTGSSRDWAAKGPALLGVRAGEVEFRARVRLDTAREVAYSGTAASCRMCSATSARDRWRSPRARPTMGSLPIV